MATSGYGHTFTKNIIWTYRENRGSPNVYFDASTEETFTKNLIFGCANNWADGYAHVPAVTNSNYFANNAFSYGESPTVWTQAQMETALGITVANINNTITAIRQAFFETPQTIHDNQNIEGWFAALKALMAKWVTYAA
jgi:hypothetical protein